MIERKALFRGIILLMEAPGKRNRPIRVIALVVVALSSVLCGLLVSGAYRESRRLVELPKKQQVAKTPSQSHGAAQATQGQPPAAKPADDSISLDELYVNLVSSLEPEKTFSLGLRLDLSLYEDADVTFIKRVLPGVRNAIIETTREQDYFHLKTTAGKLYFKELLVSRINAFLNANAVRDVRFAALLFQR